MPYCEQCDYLVSPLSSEELDERGVCEECRAEEEGERQLLSDYYASLGVL